jgi:fibrillarin-like rRNA methylase
MGERRVSTFGKIFHIWTKNRRKIAAKLVKILKIAAKSPQKFRRISKEIRIFEMLTK